MKADRLFGDIREVAEVLGDIDVMLPDVDLVDGSSATTKPVILEEGMSRKLNNLLLALRGITPGLVFWSQLTLTAVALTSQHFDGTDWNDLTATAVDEVDNTEFTTDDTDLQDFGRFVAALSGGAITSNKIGLFRVVATLTDATGTATINVPFTFIISSFTGNVVFDAAGNYVSDAAGNYVSVPI